MNTNIVGSAQRGSSRGFTLIEVLVVVAIIALLIGILLPSLNAARAQARIVMCATNLRTIMQGTMYYAQASKDEMPGGYAWDDSNNSILQPPRPNGNPWEFLHPFIAKQTTRQGALVNGGTGWTLKFPYYECPDDRMQHTTSQRAMMTSDGWQNPELPLSYNANLNTMVTSNDDDFKNAEVRKMSSMKNASSLVVCFDGGDDGSYTIGEGTISWILADCRADFGENQCFNELRHRTGNNFAFLDTHVDFYKMNYTAPFYGLPSYPVSWIPNWSPRGVFPSWVTNFESFAPPSKTLP